ncbi:MAG: dihydrofolate reductase family protein [Pseudomonadota bacterium]
MSRFLVYIAMSLDGYIADNGGSVEWLESFERDDYGYEEFVESVGSILVGRVTYEQISGFDQWPYTEIPTLVWSGGDIDGLPDGAHSWSENIEETASWLSRHAGGKDVWIFGGSQTIKAFRDAGMIDRMDIFIVPVLLGGGIRLFEGEGEDMELLELTQAQPYANGVVKLSYRKR